MNLYHRRTDWALVDNDAMTVLKEKKKSNQSYITVYVYSPPFMIFSTIGSVPWIFENRDDVISYIYF